MKNEKYDFNMIQLANYQVLGILEGKDDIVFEFSLIALV